MEKKVDFEELKRLSQNTHKVKAWLFEMLGRLERKEVLNAELTESGSKTIPEIQWK